MTGLASIFAVKLLALSGIIGTILWIYGSIASVLGSLLTGLSLADPPRRGRRLLLVILWTAFAAMSVTLGLVLHGLVAIVQYALGGFLVAIPLLGVGLADVYRVHYRGAHPPDYSEGEWEYVGTDGLFSSLGRTPPGKRLRALGIFLLGVAALGPLAGISLLGVICVYQTFGGAYTFVTVVVLLFLLSFTIGDT